MDRDGFISNGELFLVLKMMVGSNLKDQQLQQIVDKSKHTTSLGHSRLDRRKAATRVGLTFLLGGVVGRVQR